MANRDWAQRRSKPCAIKKIQSIAGHCLTVEYLNFSWSFRCFSICLSVSNLDSGVNKEGLFQNSRSSSLSLNLFWLYSPSCPSWTWSLCSTENGLGKNKRHTEHVRPVLDVWVSSQMPPLQSLTHFSCVVFVPLSDKTHLKESQRKPCWMNVLSQMGQALIS